MRSFLAFLREQEDTAKQDAPLQWWHVHESPSFTLLKISPVVTGDSTIPQAKGKRGLFISQQPWLWENYNGRREYCTEIILPDTFTEGVDYYDGQAERFVTNTNDIRVGNTYHVSEVRGE